MGHKLGVTPEVDMSTVARQKKESSLHTSHLTSETTILEQGVALTSTLLSLADRPYLYVNKTQDHVYGEPLAPGSVIPLHPALFGHRFLH